MKALKVPDSGFTQTVNQIKKERSARQEKKLKERTNPSPVNGSGVREAFRILGRITVDAIDGKDRL
ncbi:MAG: hypothetical protein V1656_02985 [Candidatus Jorgensenbacteria bacterium]